MLYMLLIPSNKLLKYFIAIKVKKKHSCLSKFMQHILILTLGRKYMPILRKFYKHCTKLDVEKSLINKNEVFCFEQLKKSK